MACKPLIRLDFSSPIITIRPCGVSSKNPKGFADDAPFLFSVRLIANRFSRWTSFFRSATMKLNMSAGGLRPYQKGRLFVMNIVLLESLGTPAIVFLLDTLGDSRVSAGKPG